MYVVKIQRKVTHFENSIDTRAVVKEDHELLVFNTSVINGVSNVCVKLHVLFLIIIEVALY